jgi:hypothetical protein
MANADPDIPASDGSHNHTLSQCVPPVIDNESDFNRLPYWIQDDVAFSYGADRIQWPDWLRERYAHRPEQALTNSSKHFEDWPAYKARIEAMQIVC